MNNSTKEFIRKWGSNVNHSALMNPIVSPKYNIAFVVPNATYQLLEILEPWCDRLYVSEDVSVNAENYKRQEQSNTKLDLSKRVLYINQNDPISENDIVVEFDGRMFNQSSFNILQQMADIINQSRELGTFELDCFKITISNLETYENTLINI